ncbi:M14 family zinc carboxypeptidase [Bacteriovoracaceae bacterium]|nr:M14 family zinc carboxypeptidase [Bacteriovoracaceae bacterium]
MKLFLVLSLFISFQSFTHQNASPDFFQLYSEERDLIVEISFKNDKNIVTQLNESGYDIAGIDHNHQVIEVVVNQNEYQHLKESSLSPRVVMTKFLLAAPDEEYKNPEEIEKILYDFETAYPDLAKVHVVGQSVEGRKIFAIQLSKKNQSEKPSVLFNGMHHAREVMSPEVNLDIIEYLLSNYKSQEKVQFWLNNLNVWVLPMLNVDGNVKVWNKNAMWRKNTKNKHGVDINRNYPHRWNGCRGSSGWKWSDTYRGDSPASEPETNTLMDLVKQIRPVFDISYHAYSQLVIYPYGCKGERTQNKQVVEKIGKKLGQLVDYKPGTSWETLYSVDGSDIDWMYHEYNVIPYVLELNSRAEGFQPNYKKWRNKTVEKNRVAWQYLLNRMFQSGVKGKIKIQGQELPMDTKISVLQLQGKSQSYLKQYEYKLRANGGFYLILTPGSYKVQVNYQGKNFLSEPITVQKTLIERNLDL